MSIQLGTHFLKEKYELYENAVKRIRGELSLGRTYDHACDTLTDLDQDLKAFVKEDFLKILIAEQHFGGVMEIADMALLLGLSYERLHASMESLLNDMIAEANYHNMSQNQTMQ